MLWRSMILLRVELKNILKVTAETKQASRRRKKSSTIRTNKHSDVFGSLTWGDREREKSKSLMEDLILGIMSHKFYIDYYALRRS